MQFIYSKDVGETSVSLSVKEYAHIFKVRRIKVKSELNFRNLNDEFIYTYKIDEINKKEALLELIKKQKYKIEPQNELHVGWSVVDPKTVEKNLAMLNEIGVTKISFVYAQFSQKQFKIDEKRLHRILINSCEQCGRSSLMQIEILKDIKKYFSLYPKSAVIDFSSNFLDENSEITSFLVGPEGGFSEEEREFFEDKKVYGLRSCSILRSESAVVGVCAKLTL